MLSDAGTGLGVAHLINTGERWMSLPGEGGHVDFAPNSEEEDDVLHALRADLGHVSAERLLSGPGLVSLYRGLVLADDPDAEHYGEGCDDAGRPPPIAVGR